MSRVVLVHGINNTYSGPETMAAEWVPALLSGLTLAGHPGSLAAEDIGCAFYGDLFRPPGRFLGGGHVGTADEAELTDDETELVAAWWQAAADSDPTVFPPSQRALSVASRTQAALAALANSRFMAGAAERALTIWIAQVRRYFTDPDLRARIQDRVAEAVTPDTQVVVGHSLGSVVAYEALCAHPDWQVEAFVTLGSPLATRTIVFDRLRPAPRLIDGRWQASWPGHVKKWTNIADRLDFVALTKTLHPLFGSEIIDVLIDNGASYHAVDRYLTEPHTGRAIADGLHHTGTDRGY